MKSLLLGCFFFMTALLLPMQAWADGQIPDTHCDAALSRFDYVQAKAEAEQVLKPDPADAAAWICLARARYEQGDFKTALEALTVAEKQQPAGALAVRMGNWFGVTLRRLGRGDEAWKYQQKALELARQTGYQAGLATALHNTAGMRYDRGDAFGALRDYQSSIPINPDLAERSASYNNVGLIYQDMGDYRRARQSMEAAIALNRANNHYHHLGKHLMNLGNLERMLGRYDTAKQLLDEGRALIEKAGDVYWLAVAARYRAWLANDLRQPEAAKAAYEEALKFYEQAGAAGDVASLKAERMARGF